MDDQEQWEGSEDGDIGGSGGGSMYCSTRDDKVRRCLKKHSCFKTREYFGCDGELFNMCMFSVHVRVLGRGGNSTQPGKPTPHSLDGHWKGSSYLAFYNRCKSNQTTLLRVPVLFSKCAAVCNRKETHRIPQQPLVRCVHAQLNPQTLLK